MAEASLGKRVRCFGCGQWFVAASDAPEPPPPSALEAPELPQPRPLLSGREVGLPGGGPHCPLCGRGVSWHAPACSHCGEELEPDDRPADRAAFPWAVRRDGEPHRGRLVYQLGVASLVAGCLSLCPTFGLGALVGLPLGVVVWVMANRDLALMGTGMMDPVGRPLTDTGRTYAIAGVLLSLCFAGLFAAMAFAP
jgi:hypothetical protein